MACRVSYNQDNKIQKVENRDGKESSLFRKISSHPTVDSLEDSLEIYKNTESEEMYQKEENYMVANRVGGEIFGSYKDALKGNPSQVEVGFLDNSGNFIPFKTVKPSFDKKTVKGFINQGIKEGYISENKETYDGQSYFQPAGETVIGVGVNEEILRSKAIVNLGWKNVKKSDNGFLFGEYLKTDKSSEVNSILNDELKEVLHTKSIEPEQETKLNENDLKLRLLDLLNSMGVNATSISDYVEKYQIKNGVEPSATALADIANKVVAFKDGNITTEDLTEETAHFIVEGWEQSEIENLLRNINKTKEYQEFSEVYRKIYGREYEGAELEQIIRREVLGKVLANSFKNNFSTENTTGTVTSIINKIKQLFDSILEFIGINTTAKVRTDLDNFTEKVNTLLYENQLANYLNTDNFSNNKFVLYSAGKESNNIKGLKVEVEKSLEVLRSSIRKLDLKNKSADLRAKRNLEKLKSLTAEQDIELQKQAALEVAAVAETQIKYLNDVIKDSKNNENLTFGANETASFQTLSNNLSPLITSIRANIEKNPELYPRKDWAKVDTDLKGINEKIDELRKNSKNIYDGVLDSLVDRMILKHDKLDETYREHVKEWLNAAHKDTTLFHRYFGQINNSNDPLLGLLSDVAERTSNGGRQEYMAGIKTFLKNLEDGIGTKPGELKQFFDKGYLVNELDQAEIEDTVAKIRAEVRKEVTGSTDSIEDVIKKAKANDLEKLDANQSVEYTKILKERLREIQETFFNEQYYKNLDKKYEDLGIGQETKNTIAGYSADRAQLMQSAITEEGLVDWSRLTKADYEFLKALKKTRKADKDFFKDDGSLKNGLSSVTLMEDVPSEFMKDGKLDPKAPAFEADGFFYFADPKKITDNVATEGLVAIDLHKLDQRYIEENSDSFDKEININNFLEKLSEVESEKNLDAALRFFETNASLMLSKDFWNEMGTDEAFIDRIENAIESEGNPQTLVSELTALKQNIARRRALLARHKDPNRPFEIEKVGKPIRDIVVDLDSKISDGYSRLSKTIEGEETSEELEKNFEIGVNRAYQAEVNDNEFTLQEEIRFIQENSSNKANDRVSNFRYNLNSESKGYAGSLTQRQREFIEEGGYDITTEEGVNTSIRDFAKSQIGSHYKRLAPKNINEDLQRSQGETVTQYVTRLSQNPNLQVTPNYSFLEDVDNTYKNPDFNPNYEGGLQVKKGDIKRTVPKFNDKGIKIGEKKEDINFESEKFKNEIKGNTVKEQTLEAILTLQRETLKNYGLEGKHNLYKLPQITRKGIDRAKDVVERVGRGGIQQGVKELFSYRVDDIEYGETVGESEVSVIPTYYTRDIKNKEELTDELFFSYASMYQQSVLHKHRKNNIGDALAIKEAIESRQDAGVGSSTKNTVAMLNNFFDYAFYGKNETQEFKVNIMGQKMDLTKFARNFLNFIKFRNLGFSTIVGATSYFTSEINFQIEKYVGEIINKEATRLGTKEWARLAKDSVTEVGKLRSKSKLNILGEYFNIFKSEERFDSSNYGYLARNFSRLPMSVHAMGNFPITPRAMMGVLHDFRVTEEGVIKKYSGFQRDEANKGVSQSEIDSKWKALEDKVIYNYLDVSEEGVKFTEGLKQELREDFQTDEYLQTQMEGVTTSIKRAASQLDTQITSEQRVAAQRHFAMNYLMTHRGWLSVALSNRTKNSHYNLATGEFEEGSYRTVYNMFSEAITESFKAKNIKEFREVWNGKNLKPKKGVSVADQLLVRRRNIRRVVLDSTFLAGMSGIAYILLQAADDDESNPALQFTSYLALRVLNEQVSSQSGLPYQMYETLESPFVGLNVVKDTFNLFPQLATGSEIIKSGKYKGETERMRAVKKVVPGMKTIDDMNKLKQTRDTYYFYNSSNLKWSPISAMLVSALDD